MRRLLFAAALSLIALPVFAQSAMPSDTPPTPPLSGQGYGVPPMHPADVGAGPGHPAVKCQPPSLENPQPGCTPPPLPTGTPHAMVPPPRSASVPAPTGR